MEQVCLWHPELEHNHRGTFFCCVKGTVFISRMYLSRIMSRCCSHQMLIKSLSRMSESVEYYNSTECLIQYLVISHFALFKFCGYGRSGIILLKLVEEESNEERDLHGSPFLPTPSPSNIHSVHGSSVPVSSNSFLCCWRKHWWLICYS